MSDDKKNVIKRAFEWALSVDAIRAKKQLAQLRAKHPKASNRQLAWKMIRRARWWATGAGAATGLPANPWVSVPAAVADVGAVLRVEISLAARIALLYDESYFDEETAPYELLVPIFGARATSEALKEMAVRGGMGVSRQVIKKYLSKETLKQFKKIMLKYFGLKVTQKAVVTKTLPIVGAVIGGGWNFSELTVVGKRVVRYFENEELRPESPTSAGDSDSDDSE